MRKNKQNPNKIHFYFQNESRLTENDMNWTTHAVHNLFTRELSKRIFLFQQFNHKENNINNLQMGLTIVNNLNKILKWNDTKYS